MALENNKIAFLFPGQGSQFVGMGKGLVGDSEKVNGAMEYFREADDVLGFSISKLCWEGPAEELNRTENSQPALLLTGYVAAALLEKKGVTPDYVAGHSLGEYTALTFGGAFSFADGLRLVRRRGEIMNTATPPGTGKMAALLGVDEEMVLDVIMEASNEESRVEIANLNCPGQIVIGGHSDAVLRACEIVKRKGVCRSVVLDVAVPSHTSLMEPVKIAFGDFLDEIGIKSIRVPLISNISAEIVDEPEEIRTSLVSQLTCSVFWEKSIRKLISLGVNVFIEVGAGRVLSGLVRKIDRGVTSVSVSSIGDLDKTCDFL